MEKQDSEASGLKPSSEDEEPMNTRQTKQDEPNKKMGKGGSKIQKLWAKTGLDLPTLLTMFKAAVPPTIAIAFFQADAVAREYTTLGYLVGISSILGFSIMPRAKFIQTMLLNTFAVCLGASIGLFAVWSAIIAREHTTPRGRPLRGYNSSASAVCAIWLFFQILVVNALRSARPQLQFPAIVYSIFIDIFMIYGPIFSTVSQATSFAVTLLKAFLTGFALCTGTSLFIFPVNSRKVVFSEIIGYLKCMNAVWDAQTAYFHSHEHANVFASTEKREGDPSRSKIPRKRGVQKKTKANVPFQTVSAEAEALKGAEGAAITIHGKLHADLTFAKREFAFSGKLSGSNMAEIFRLLQLVLLPTIGLSAIADMFERIAKFRKWDRLDDTSSKGTTDVPDSSRQSFAEWQATMRALCKPFAAMMVVMSEAIQHVLYTLELEKRPKTDIKADREDIESRGNMAEPEENNFAAYFEHKLQDFQQSRKEMLRLWCEERGVQLPADSFESSAEWPNSYDNPDESHHRRDQRQVFLILYMEHMLVSASRGLLELVKFADSKVEDGTMKKKRFIFPPYKRVKKWVKNVFSTEDASNNDHRIMAELDSSHDVDLGDAFNARRDPEHLPAVTPLEKVGNYVRVIPNLLRSPHTVFGFRAACATMSIAIVAYLHDTQNFFTQQRLVWALIMVAFSMARTSGQSVFNFVLRVFGTFVAMVAAYVVWYIVDGKAPGVIVFLFVWIFSCFYMVIKKPHLVIVGIISSITTLLIIGYELQVQKIGVKASTASGQPYYPIYSLAPYRLATVAGGLLVAYIWTIFPFPITESAEMRKDMGGSLFLLANLYSVIHSTVISRFNGDYALPSSSPNPKSDPSHRLDRMRHDIFSKTNLLLTKLRTGQGFAKWQVSIGGRFPHETYDHIITCAERVLTYTALIGFASASFAPGVEGSGQDGSAAETEWQRDFRRLLASLAPTSHQITSRLALLSSSVANGQPLPPYMRPLEPYHLLRRLEAIDAELLSVKHIDEPGYAAFAVLQIASRSVVSDVNALTEHVRKLVGELDFSFHIVSTADDESSTSTAETVGTTGEGDADGDKASAARLRGDEDANSGKTRMSHKSQKHD